MSATKRIEGLNMTAVQDGSRDWWTANPMAYDWRGELDAGDRFGPAWFDAIDSRFLEAARLYATDRRPFDRLIPFERLTGARVLEIGCGMGLHTELMALAGAQLTSIDLTSTAVEATTRRLALKGLSATVLQADAESLPFDSQSFDFVWSWGVIHHSSRTARIVRHIARVLTPGGECRIMVYNRYGMPARLAFLRDHLLSGAFLSRTFDETLYASTDGFSARYYTEDLLADLFRGFFLDVDTSVYGQAADAVPLPRRLRSLALKIIPQNRIDAAQRTRGGFLFVTAKRPW